jgi:two-component system, OmpR family, response regulator
MRQEEHRHRVLIVDDEESTRLLLARLLATELSVDAQLAGTCEQALRLANNHVYDAITLDLIMPGIGGLAVLKELRAASLNAHTPVIVVSIVGERAMIDQCMSEGADAYHVKPVRRAELVAEVKSLLSARARPRSLAS